MLVDEHEGAPAPARAVCGRERAGWRVGWRDPRAAASIAAARARAGAVTGRRSARASRPDEEHAAPAGGGDAASARISRHSASNESGFLLLRGVAGAAGTDGGAAGGATGGARALSPASSSVFSIGSAMTSTSAVSTASASAPASPSGFAAAHAFAGICVGVVAPLLLCCSSRSTPDARPDAWAEAAERWPDRTTPPSAPASSLGGFFGSARAESDRRTAVCMRRAAACTRRGVAAVPPAGVRTDAGGGAGAGVGGARSTRDCATASLRWSSAYSLAARARSLAAPVASRSARASASLARLSARRTVSAPARADSVASAADARAASSARSCAALAARASASSFCSRLTSAVEPPSAAAPAIGAPSATWRARVPKLSEIDVSAASAGAGDAVTAMHTRAPRESVGCDRATEVSAQIMLRALTNILTAGWSSSRLAWSSRVSFELRYGTWASLAPSARTTSPSADSDLLIAAASPRRSPDACVRLRRSEPARSTSARWALGAGAGGEQR